MPEKTYMNKKFCLECATKHGNRLEHHLEDLVTSSEDRPELRGQALEMLDKIRNVRKRVDKLRLEEMLER